MLVSLNSLLNYLFVDSSMNSVVGAIPATMAIELQLVPRQGDFVPTCLTRGRAPPRGHEK